MPITHDFNAEDSILISRAFGMITPHDGLESHRRIAEYAREVPHLKLVADMRKADVAADAATVVELMKAFYDIVGRAIPVAFIVRDQPEDPNPVLAETQAYIEGARLRSFCDEASAVAWLKAGAPRG
ncbi:hypothetical protein [Maricaulis sp. CAU 1757]